MHAPRTLARTLLVAACALGVLGCVTSTGDSAPDGTAVAPGELVWPAAPDPPRIAWEGSVTLPADLGIRPSFWVRARRLITGGPRDHLERPQGLALAAGRLYVADPGRGAVFVYDLPRKRFQALPGNARRPWRVPTSVAGLANGTLFVADAVGTLFRTVPPYTDADPLPWPALVRPVAVAVDEAAGRLYVLDAGTHQLHRGRLDGTYADAVGSRGIAPGKFNFPTHLCVAADGTLLVTDAMNFRIQHLTPEGEALGAFGRAGDGTGQFAKPKGVAIDAAGTIYVVDAIHSVVQMFDGAGRYLMHFGAPGRKAGEFWLPTGIALDDAGRIYVADSYNHRVQIFTRLEVEAS